MFATLMKITFNKQGKFLRKKKNVYMPFKTFKNGCLHCKNVQGYFRFKNADLLGDAFSLNSYDFLLIQWNVD